MFGIKDDGGKILNNVPLDICHNLLDLLKTSILTKRKISLSFHKDKIICEGDIVHPIFLTLGEKINGSLISEQEKSIKDLTRKYNLLLKEMKNI